MKTLPHNTVKLILLSAIAAPFTLFAAENTANEHASHHPAQVQSRDGSVAAAQQSFDQLQERMQVRMRAMQQMTDPQARSAIMMAQMQDMQETMKGTSVGCPMAGSMGGVGMMGNDMHDHMARGVQR